MKTLYESILDSTDKQVTQLNDDVELSKYFDKNTAFDSWMNLYNKFEDNPKNKVITSKRKSAFQKKGIYLCITGRKTGRKDIIFVDTATSRRYEKFVGLSIVTDETGVYVWKGAHRIPALYGELNRNIFIEGDWDEALSLMNKLDQYAERNRLYRD